VSIVTKTGDQGETGLMYNRRVPKSNARIEACGAVDELNAALGLARAAAANEPLKGRLLQIQKALVTLMGEIGVEPEDRARYEKDGFPRVNAAMTAVLESWVKEIEDQKVSFKGWAMPGATSVSAALDFARTVCRRAERRVCAVKEKDQLENREVIVYLNRLSDLLWLFARQEEALKP
jgi:cob(I)alamin adenosyltransferase